MKTSIKSSANTTGGENKGKRAGILPKLSLMAFLTLTGVGVTQEASAQTRDITKDTTEIRTFFKNPKIFSAEEMKEFDTLRNNNLKSPIGEFVMKEIMINFDAKSSDYEATVFTCLLLDPNGETSIGRQSRQEVEGSKILMETFKLISGLIKKRIELKLKKDELKLKEDELKKLQEFGKELDDMVKVFKQLGNK